MVSSSIASPKHTNRLAGQSSPYLLQHAHNPVDWYAWGPEAFEAARKQNKPIFLSIGYSTCYWCHVMERQCFEDEAIAAQMNQGFVNIKVDREERPDVDQLYMTAVQVLTRQGGWPLSVFLMPDLRPFYGGTYFGPADQGRQPGFPTLLRAIEDTYRNRLPEVEQTASQLLNILGQLAEPLPPEAPMVIDHAFIDSLVERSVADYDEQWGGFGAAPKFPRQTLLQMLLVYGEALAGNPDFDPAAQRSGRTERVFRMVLHTLDAMARGGIHDHLGGAFHRYSTDERWLVPHFEIMLYDNALLAWLYVEAYRQTEELRYAHVARGILDFVLRELTSPQGAFYTALDAEVDAREGASYLWTAQEIVSLLGDESARLFNRVYGVDHGPNFADPHQGTGRPDHSILFLPRPLEQVAADLNMATTELDRRLEAMRQTLYAARRQRQQPRLDNKVVTGWNALMIRALAYAGQVLQDQRYLDAAARAADFLLKAHRALDGGLYHTSCDGQAKIEGFLDDYAFLIQALMELRDASGLDQWKGHAALLASSMIGKFEDPAKGGFFFTDTNAVDLIVRQKVGSDNPLPSGNAVAAMTMLLFDRPPTARATLAVFAAQLAAMGESMSAMVEAAQRYVRRFGAIDVLAVPEASGADRPLSPQQLAAGVVSLRGTWINPTLLNLHVSILSGFHINAHNAAEGVVAVHLAVSSGSMRVEGIDYPEGELVHPAFSAKPLRVYDGEVVISLRFSGHPGNGGTIKLTLHYQACDNNACLPPVSKQIELVVP